MFDEDVTALLRTFARFAADLADTSDFVQGRLQALDGLRERVERLENIERKREGLA